MLSKELPSSAAMSDTKALKIKAIRDSDNNLLCVEADGAFVEMLHRVQHIPMGTLAKLAADDEEDNAFARLQTSMANVRGQSFRDADARSEGAMAEDTSVDLQGLIDGAKAKSTDLEVVTTNNLEGSSKRIPFRLTNERNTWTEGVAFCGVGESFEVAIKYESDTIPLVMLGVVPDDDDLVNKMKDGITTYSSLGCFLYINGTDTFYTYPKESAICLPKGTGCAEVRMRFKSSPHPLLEYCLQGGEWRTYPQEKFSTYIPSPLPKCCPVILLRKNGNKKSLTVTEVSGSAQQHPVVCSNDKSYLVTRDMEVLENGSFSSTIQLLRRFHISDLSNLRVESARFGEDELRRLIKAVFRGEQDLFSEALPALTSDSSGAKTDVDDETDTTATSVSGQDFF